MADYWPANNGNWSTLSNWLTATGVTAGRLPMSADDVYADNKNVYVDIGAWVSTVRTTQRTGGTAGGRFYLNNSVSLTATAIGGSTNCVTLTASGTSSLYGNISGSASAASCVVNGGVGTLNLYGNGIGGSASGGGSAIVNSSSGVTNIYGTFRGGTGTNTFGIGNNSTGVVNVYGNVHGGNSGTTTHGVNNNSTGVVNVSGVVQGGAIGYGAYNVTTGQVNITGGCIGGSTNIPGAYNSAGGNITLFGVASGTAAHGIQNNSTGTVNVSGSAIGSSTAATYGAYNASTGTIQITGNAIGGLASGAYGAYNASTGVLRAKKAIGNDWGLGYTTALGGVAGVYGAQNSQTFVEELQCGPRGQWPTAGNVYFTPNPKAVSVFKTETFQNYTLVESNSADSLLPSISSVRQGVIYNTGNSQGTCIIPPISSVALGAFVDDKNGTAFITPTSIWNVSGSEIKDNQSIGGRLNNILTTNTATKIIDSFTNK